MEQSLHTLGTKSLIILLVAAFWDYLLGDPIFLLHPVQVMGWIIKKYSDYSIKFLTRPWVQRLSGVFLGFSLIAGSIFLSWLGLGLIYQTNFWLGSICELVLLASCFAGRSLRTAVENVLTPLKNHDVLESRKVLAMYVGRDTANLSEPEILRALLETVAENAVDGITAPLFYAIVGVALGVGCVPLALGYKAASTLDSMVGYLRPPYTHLGWFSAQLEDRLTWVPCRLTVLTLALFSGKPRTVLAICRRDAISDPSPNSGWSECIYAAILGVQLGGANTYQGEIKIKPLLGNSDRQITTEVIQQALNLTRYCFLFWLAIATALLTNKQLIISLLHGRLN